MLKLFRLHVPELRFWKIKKKYEKIETGKEIENKNKNRRKILRKKTEGKKHGVYAF